MQDRAQAARLVEVALADIPVDHHRAVFADSREEGLDLGRCAVLGLVEQHEGIFPRPPAHHLERHHFDIALLKGDLVGRLAHPLTNRVHHRRGPVHKLVLQRAGKISERTSAWHVWSRQNDLVDAAIAEEIGRIGRGDPGLSGSGGPQDDDLRAVMQSIKVGSLLSIERLHWWQCALELEFGALELDDFSGLKRSTTTASFVGLLVIEVLVAEVLTQSQTPLLEQAEWSHAA